MAWLSLAAGTDSAKLNKNSITLGEENLHVDRVEWNELVNGLRGKPVSGKHFLGLGNNTADPIPYGSTPAGLGAGRAHLWWDDTDDALTFRESGVNLERRVLDDQGAGVYQLPTLAVAPAVAPVGKARFYYDSALGKWQQSVNTGAWADMIAGGGGGGTVTSVTAANSTITIGGTATDPTVSINLGNANTWTAAQTMPNGAVGTPGLVLGEAGLYRPGASRLGIAFGGALKHDFASTYFATQTGVPVYVGDPGTNTVPGLSWLADQNTGRSNDAADTLTDITGGTARWIMSTTQIVKTLPLRAESGSAGTPAYSYLTDIDCGRYYVSNRLTIIEDGEDGGADGEAFSVDGVEQWYVTRDETVSLQKHTVRIAGAKTNSPEIVGGWSLLGGTVAAGFGARHVVELENASGAEITAGYMEAIWEDATNTSEDMAWSWQAVAAGSMAERMRLTSLGALKVGPGSASLPSHSWLADPDTGWFNSAADTIGGTLGGTQRVWIDGTRFQYKGGAGTLEGGHLAEFATNATDGTVNTNSTSTAGYARFRAVCGTGVPSIISYGSGNAGSRGGLTIANGSFLQGVSAPFGFGTATAHDVTIFANDVEFVRCVSGGDLLVTAKLKLVSANQQTTVGAAGGASALPATPLGYWKATRADGTAIVFPYFNAA